MNTEGQEALGVYKGTLPSLRQPSAAKATKRARQEPGPDMDSTGPQTKAGRNPGSEDSELRAPGRCQRGWGRSRVSEDLRSSQTLGACGARTFGRRSGHRPGTGISSHPSGSGGEHAGWSGRQRRGCNGSRKRASPLRRDTRVSKPQDSGTAPSQTKYSQACTGWGSLGFLLCISHQTLSLQTSSQVGLTETEFFPPGKH